MKFYSLFNSKKKIKRLNIYAFVAFIAIELILLIFKVADFSIDIYGKDYANDFTLPLALIVLVLYVLFIACIYAVFCYLKNASLFEECNQNKFLKMNSKKDNNKYLWHNKSVKLINNFYNGEFELSLVMFDELLKADKLKGENKQEFYRCALFSAFFLEKRDLCEKYMNEYRYLFGTFGDSKEIVLSEIAFVDSYLKGKFNDAMKSLNSSDELYNIHKSLYNYLKSMCFSKINNRDKLILSLEEVVKIDNKTYFALEAERILNKIK